MAITERCGRPVEHSRVSGGLRQMGIACGAHGRPQEMAIVHLA